MYPGMNDSCNWPSTKTEGFQGGPAGEGRAGGAADRRGRGGMKMGQTSTLPKICIPRVEKKPRGKAGTISFPPAPGAFAGGCACVFRVCISTFLAGKFRFPEGENSVRVLVTLEYPMFHNWICVRKRIPTRTHLTWC